MIIIPIKGRKIKLWAKETSKQAQHLQMIKHRPCRVQWYSTLRRRASTDECNSQCYPLCCCFVSFLNSSWDFWLQQILLCSASPPQSRKSEWCSSAWSHDNLCWIQSVCVLTLTWQHLLAGGVLRWRTSSAVEVWRRRRRRICRSVFFSPILSGSNWWELMIEDHSYLHPTTRASAASSSSSCCVLLQHTNSWPSVSSPRAKKPLVSFLPSKYPTAAAAAAPQEQH